MRNCYPFLVLGVILLFPFLGFGHPGFQLDNELEEVSFEVNKKFIIAHQVSLIHCKVAFSSMEHLHNSGVEVDGLLSVDLFRLGRVTLNYQRKEIRIWVNENIFAMKYRPLNISP